MVSIASALAVWGYSRNESQKLFKHEHQDALDIRNAQIASCRRVNKLRRQFNQRGVAINDFADSQIKLYILIRNDPTSTSNQKKFALLQVGHYRGLKDDFKQVAIVNCDKVVQGEK